MRTGKYRRKRVSKRILVQAQARLIRLSPEQAERRERHRGYLELYWNSPVSPTEAFVDLVGLNVDSAGTELSESLCGERCLIWSSSI